MNHIAFPATLLLALAAAQPAQAAGDGRFSARITGGTLGIGPELAYRTTHFGVRANATFLSASKGLDSEDVHYEGKIRLRSGGAMLDVYPFGGGFFLSGGARINGNEARASAMPMANVQVGNMVFTPAQVGTLSGDAETKNFAPSLTIGYAGQLQSGLFTGIEAGALFQGSVRIRNFRSSTNLIPAADIERERLDLQDDVDGYKVYPIVQFTIGYRF